MDASESEIGYTMWSFVYYGVMLIEGDTDPFHFQLNSQQLVYLQDHNETLMKYNSVITNGEAYSAKSFG